MQAVVSSYGRCKEGKDGYAEGEARFRDYAQVEG
jgi:hypothetical protein